MFTSVLTALKPSDKQQYVMDYAIALAQALQVEVTACTVLDEAQIAPSEPVPLGAGSFKQELDHLRMAAARKQAEHCSQAMLSAAAQAGVPCRAEIREGDVVELLGKLSHEHDVLVVGHGAGDDTGSESLLYRILKHAPRPAIVFPKQAFSGEAVVVAYDGSVQAARTLSSFAQSGLGIGRPVHVIACNADLARASDLCGIAGRFLQRHGMQVETHAEPLAHIPAQALMQLAAECSAGLLVMGAFGKSVIREFFLGSVTQRVLHELPLPVFLDH